MLCLSICLSSAFPEHYSKFGRGSGEKTAVFSNRRFYSNGNDRCAGDHRPVDRRGIGFYNGYIENSKITKAKSQISVMQGAMDSFYAGNGVYPSTAAELQLSGIDTAALDPWGKNYVISVSSTEGGENNCYVIHTGFALVHQNKVVAGSGKWGRSQEPDVVDPPY